MVNALLKGLLNFIISLISVVMAPLDTALNTLLPSFSDVLTLFGNFIDRILSIIPWALSWFHIPTALLSFVCLYLIAKITISVGVHEIKLALAWYRKLMP